MGCSSLRCRSSSPIGLTTSPAGCTRGHTSRHTLLLEAHLVELQAMSLEEVGGTLLGVVIPDHTPCQHLLSISAKDIEDNCVSSLNFDSGAGYRRFITSTRGSIDSE